jgi:hypothetical protein
MNMVDVSPDMLKIKQQSDAKSESTLRYCVCWGPVSNMFRPFSALVNLACYPQTTG